MDTKQNVLARNAKRWWNAGFIGKIGLGFVLVLIVTVAVTIATWVWNLGPVKELRESIALRYSDLRMRFWPPKA